MSRDAIAVLFTKNLLHNLEVIKTMLAKHSCTKIIAMVKANAYGHGLRSVSKRLDGLVHGLGVASIDEAMALRAAGVTANIMLMEGMFHADEISPSLQNNFHLIIHNFKQVTWLTTATLSQKVNIFIKYDSGMTRLGFNKDEDLLEAIRLLKVANVANNVGIISHLSSADDKEYYLNKVQISRFEQLVKVAKERFGNYIGDISFVNSAGIVNFTDQYYDIARPGLALYGVSPVQGRIGRELNLKPVMQLLTKILSIKHIESGSTIGYNGTYLCEQDRKIGIVAFGHGDGYPVKLKEDAHVIVRGQKCKIVGKISMDMMAIDVSHLPFTEEGDQVSLWGDELPIEDVSAFSYESPWSLFSGIQNRVKFHWVD